MTTEEKFRAAVNVIRSLPKNGAYQPSHALMLRFYAYFKQATEGPCLVSKPAFWEVVKKAKWDAWHKLGDMPETEAMENYVEELKKIIETMSYTDNVASFLESLGSFYETVPQEDLQMLVGNLMKKVSSRDNSPLRIPTHLPSSIDSSPISSYEDKSYSPNNALGVTSESDSDADEFIDTVESAPESSAGKGEAITFKGRDIKSIPNGDVVSMKENSMIFAPGPKVIHENGMGVQQNGEVKQNGTSPKPKDLNVIDTNGVKENGVNGVHENGVKENGFHHNGISQNGGSIQMNGSVRQQNGLKSQHNGDAPHENGIVNKHERSRKRDKSSLNPSRVRGGAAGSCNGEEGSEKPWGRMNGVPPGTDISEDIRQVVLHLQHDLEKITARVKSLEVTKLSQSPQTRLKSRSPAWWPFPGLPSKTVLFLVMWPIVTQAVILWLQRRNRSRRL